MDTTTTVKTASEVISTLAENTGAVLKLATDTIAELISNPYVLLFMTFGMVMWGVHLFHTIRKL